MSYIITDKCTKCGACLDVCPVKCIYSTPEDDQYYVNPEECIECATCVPECPVNAIFNSVFVELNAEYDFSKASNKAE